MSVFSRLGEPRPVVPVKKELKSRAAVSCARSIILFLVWWRSFRMHVFDVVVLGRGTRAERDRVKMVYWDRARCVR